MATDPIQDPRNDVTFNPIEGLRATGIPRGNERDDLAGVERSFRPTPIAFASANPSLTRTRGASVIVLQS
jgi:hypothetical protein